MYNVSKGLPKKRNLMMHRFPIAEKQRIVLVSEAICSGVAAFLFNML